MTKVLMVCLGNICRSPLAEGILKSKVNSQFVYVDSAGTAGYHVGNPPDPRSVSTAMRHGIDISQQRCRRFERSDFQNFDFIYAMDKSNYLDIITLAKTKEETSKVKLLLQETSLEIQEVPDPYYGGEDGFETVFKMVSVACDNLVNKINNHGN